MNTLDKQEMESRLETVLSDYSTLANQFEETYELHKDKPQLVLLLSKEGLEKLILGFSSIDGHKIESIKFDGDLKVTLKKIKD